VEWSERASAILRALATEEDAPSESQVTVLIDVLREGNGIIRAAWLEPEPISVGEGFGEVYSRLFGVIWQYGDHDESAILETLVRGAYNGDSAWAREVSEVYGQEIASVLLDLADSSVSAERHQAIEMMGNVVEFDMDLSQEAEERMRAVIVAATTDASIPVRQRAVQALGRVGTDADIPLLRMISENDPAAYSDRPDVFPVRRDAEEAIQAITSR
jgi:hypothetical protein